jgi:hypothetical protein
VLRYSIIDFVWPKRRLSSLSTQAGRSLPPSSLKLKFPVLLRPP